MTIAASELFAALSHATRLRCLVLLSRHAELCVCELTHAMGASQPHVSRHLAHLRELGLLLDRREGLWIYYSINPSVPDWVRGVLSETATGLEGQSPHGEDLERLAQMPDRPGSSRCA